MFTEMPLAIPMADVPSSVTIVVALITGITGVLGGFLSATKQVLEAMGTDIRTAQPAD